MTAGIIGFARAETSERGYVRGHGMTLASLISQRISTYSGWIFTLWILDYHTLRSKRKKKAPKHRVFFVTWSWWSKKVLIHALELASQTFTLLSDELRVAEERQHLTCFTVHLSVKTLWCLAALNSLFWHRELGNFFWKTASVDNV